MVSSSVLAIPSYIFLNTGASSGNGTGGNTSFNQNLTDTLYYPLNLNPLGYYNSSTLPGIPSVGSNNTLIIADECAEVTCGTFIEVEYT